MADLFCRRFVLTVLADTADLLPIQNMADQIRSKFTIVWEFDFHDKTDDKLIEVARLRPNEENNF